MLRLNLLACSRRLLSSSYRGKRVPESSSDPSQSQTFRRARVNARHRAIPVQEPLAVAPETKRVLFRREETTAARFLGPLAIFNVGGALFFCATIVNGSAKEQSQSVEGELAVPLSAKRSAACGAALLSAGAVVYAATQFTRRRLVELRVVGRCIQLYTRSMAGLPPIVLAQEVPLQGIAVNLSRLEVAAKLREDNFGKTIARRNDDSCLTIDILSDDGTAVKPNGGYTIDTFDASILDTAGLRGVALDSRLL